MFKMLKEHQCMLYFNSGLYEEINCFFKLGPSIYVMRYRTMAARLNPSWGAFWVDLK